MRRLGEWVTNHARGAVVPAKQRDIIVSHLSVGRQYSCPYPTTAPHLYTARCGVRGHHLILFLGGCCGGVFAQRGHSADYYAVYPGSTPENHSPTEACMIHSKQHRGCRTLGPVASITLIKKIPGAPAEGRVQMSRPWDPWLPAMENNRLFAQRGHSARCAPCSIRIYSICWLCAMFVKYKLTLANCVLDVPGVQHHLPILQPMETDIEQRRMPHHLDFHRASVSASHCGCM